MPQAHISHFQKLIARFILMKYFCHNGICALRAMSLEYNLVIILKNYSCESKHILNAAGPYITFSKTNHEKRNLKKDSFALLDNLKYQSNSLKD